MFITFEGGEGSGKTTIINLLKEYFVSINRSVLVTREPGGTKISEKIRDILLDPLNTEMNPYTESILFAASRTQHLKEVIEPALKNNMVVICDRFLDSSMAYQAYARELGEKFVKQVNCLALKCEPDLTFFFNLDPKIGLKRIENRSKRDRLDQAELDFHEKVRQGYLILAKKNKKRIHIIDGTKTKEEIFTLVLDSVKKII